MFWGLILKANKKYTQTLEKPFHLTKAALDYANAEDDPVQVMYSDGQATYLLCTLQKGKELQCGLDLTFNEGDKLCFSTKGNGIVHLTGSLIPEDDFNYDPMVDDEDDSEEISEEEEEEAVPDLREKLLKKKKEKEKAGKKDQKKKAVPVEEDSSEAESDEEPAQNGDKSLDSSAAVEDDSDDDEGLEFEEESDDDDDESADDEEEAGDEDDSDEEEVEMPPKKQAKLDPQAAKKQQKNGLENGQKKDKKEKTQQKEQQQVKKDKPQPVDNSTKKLQGGLMVQDLKAGQGAEAKPGKKIQVYYEGRLKSNNKVFDSTKSGPGFKMTLGRGEVIKAWDIGLAGMKVGGKRRLTCPPALAYGAKGNPPVIPANSTLIFDVELKNVL